jgi:hypothetical protein
MNPLKAINRTFGRLQKRVFGQKKVPGLLGRADGTVVAGEGLVYVTLRNGDVIVVSNAKVPNRPYMKVWIGKDEYNPAMMQVLSERYVYGKPLTASLPLHGEKHQWPNEDAVWVDGNQFLPLLAMPGTGGDFYVKLYAAIIKWMDGTKYVKIQPPEINLSSLVPTNGAIYALLQVDDTGTLTAKAGTQVEAPELLTMDEIPMPDAGQLELWAVRLYSGMDRIHKDKQVNDFVDLRWGRDAGAKAPPTTTAANDVQVGDGSGNWIKKTLAEFVTIIRTSLDSIYAAAAKGVTNGDSHDHNGGDGAQIAYSSLSGLPTIPAAFTAEDAQDAVGAMIDTTLVYVDAAPLLTRAALTGDVTAPQGSNVTTIANDVVTNDKAANMAQSSIKGRAAGAGTGDPTDLTADQALAILQGGSTPLGFSKYVFQGRLTLTSGTPYPMASVTDGSTLYLTPLPTGNLISLYTSSAWKLYTLTEISLTLTSLATASRPYDIFVYDNSGALTLEAVAWANTTTRSTALDKQDGVYVKNGAADRRYVGTVYIDGAKKSSDIIGGTVNSTTPTRKHVWNYYNRVLTSAKKTNFADGHTYNSATYRKWNNTAAMDVEIVIGIAEKPYTVFMGGNQRNGATCDVMTNWSSGGGWLVDWYNASASQISAFVGGAIVSTDVGLVTFSVIEASPAATTATFSTCVMDVIYEY